MNPIARMMKRYIKTPLKYALPLLFVGALVLVATTGCTSTSNTTQNLSGGGGGGQAGVAVKINSIQNFTQLGTGSFPATPTPGNKFVVFDVTVTNLNENDHDIGARIISNSRRLAERCTSTLPLRIVLTTHSTTYHIRIPEKR